MERSPRHGVAGRHIGLLLAVLAAGCDGLLDVDTTGILTPDDLDDAGPAAIAPIINGVVYNYHEAADDIARYAALFTDEMIAAATGSIVQVDERFVQPSNLALTASPYTTLHEARHLADTTFLVLQSRLSDPAYSTVELLIRQGIAMSKLYSGLARVWLAELYCWSILTGVHPETEPLMPDARVRQALGFLREAEGEASVIGFERVRLAALAGQARAHLWLGEYDLATALAAGVPREFRYIAEYSQNAPSQYNEVYARTWGDAASLAWTIGSGEVPSRGNELWEHFERFVRLNLIVVRPPGFISERRVIPVMLQTLYQRQDSEILVASGIEAMLIRAEAAVRGGQTSVAEQILNDLRSDYSLRVLLHSKVPLPLPANEFAPLTLSGDMASDLKTVADERARELWLTGDRLTTSRRFRHDAFGIDIFPPVKVGVGGGDDTALPIPQLELDTNPNLSPSMACPAGQTVGSWR